jgi:uncharacterized membrane protein YbaN (DUF454 family)
LKLHAVKRYVYVFIGTLSLALGMIGIFVPVLPTTPFLLLSSYCYLRGSKRMYDWLINHKVFGPYIFNYLTYKAIPRKIKASAIIFLWCTLTISMFIIPLWYVRIFFIVVGLAVTIHLLRLKTLRNEDLKKASDF